MLTNLRDAFIGQSRSPNIVPFHMIDIVSYCAIVTLSLTIFDLKCRDLEIWVRGHSRSKIERKSPNFPPPVYLTPPLKGFPLEFCIGAGVSEN